jgi:hypothetical protein
MRFRAILREASRGVLSGTARTLAFLCITVVLIGGLVSVDLVAIRQLIREAQDFRESGAATLIVTAPGRVDGARCRGLAEVVGVEASGAIRPRADAFVVEVLPSAPLLAFDVTPGFGALLGVSDTVGGALVSRDVAETLVIAPGKSVAVRGGALDVGASYSYPDDGRRPGLAWAALLESVDTAPFDECWLRAWPPSEVSRSLLLATVDPGDDAPDIIQLNTTRGAEFDGPEQYAGRVTAPAPLAAAVLAFAVGVAAVRLRRLEWASNLHAGARRRDLVSVALLEAASWLIPALVVVIGAGVFLVAGEDASDHASLVVGIFRIASLALVGAVIGVLIGMHGVREHHLVRYVKDR